MREKLSLIDQLNLNVEEYIKRNNDEPSRAKVIRVPRLTKTLEDVLGACRRRTTLSN